MVNQYVRLGDLEEWTIINTSKEQHPFHIHVNDFQVMSIWSSGRAVPSPSDEPLSPCCTSTAAGHFA